MPSRKILDKFIAEKRCQRCGNANDRHPMSRCSSCAVKETLNLKKRVDEGRCQKCSKPLVMGETAKGCKNCTEETFYFGW